jgi:L-ascorbate metabolism protein UlaG (beta-lactamase superfamily)
MRVADSSEEDIAGPRPRRCGPAWRRQVADRLQVGTALVYLGGVRLPVSGPVRYTMTARDAVELCCLIRPRTAIPIHYEGWSHFQLDRARIEHEFANAPADTRRCLHFVPIGTGVEVAV